MSQDKALKDFKYDKRLLDHNLKTGMITEEEYKKHLQTLPDLAAQCERVEIESKDDGSDSH